MPGGSPLRDTLEELRWRREGVGCSEPVKEPAWAGSFGSSRTPEVALEAMEVVEATDAE
jgi:hypothetical protein